ncbi:aldehyde dehydrogenase family protein [Nocardioides humi]
MFIGGSWLDPHSEQTLPVLNPATGAVLCDVPAGDASDVDAAVSAARAAFDGPWQTWRPYDRQRLLLRLADLFEENVEEIARLETMDMGAPLSRTRMTSDRCVRLLRWYAANSVLLHGETIRNSATDQDFLTYTAREPVGVVGAIVPWNAPMVMCVWKAGPALATGCTIVIKPAEEAPLAPLYFAEMCRQAGVPDGVVNVVTGDGETAGAALAAHSGVDKVSFTGSTTVGRAIVQASAANLKRVTLELGGKSPDIVLRDADLDKAVPGAAMAVFANSGQICSAGTRLFVEESVYDEFVERLAAFADDVVVADGFDVDAQIGPVISASQLNRIRGYLENASTEGARTVTGGIDDEQNSRSGGFFVRPTVFADVKDDMRIAREEIFGPVISALRFTDIDEVAHRANQLPYGLGAGVWTRDIGHAHRLADRLRSGTVWVNCYQRMDPAVPFGGFKESGYGREGGKEQFDDYLNTKAVWISTDGG